MIRLKILTMIVVVACTACATTTINLLSTDFESYTVILTPNLGTNVLDIVTGPQGSDSVGKQNGWVGFALDKNGTITFTMNALPSKSVCTGVADTTAEWVISKIELTKTGIPATQKGINFGTAQNGWIETAFPQMDESNGNVDAVGIGTISVVVQNLNNNIGMQNSYYRITAERCSNGDELMADPGVGNGGRS
jgi:hypothetical protein